MNLLKKVISTFVLIISCGLVYPVSASMERPKPNFKFVFFGKSGVGKTSLLERVVNNTFTEDKSKTVGLESDCILLKDFSIIFLDTPEKIRCASAIPSIIKDTPIAIIVLDVNDSSSELKKQYLYWLNLVQNYNQDNIFIVANKVDQLDDSNVDNMSEIKAICENFGYHFCETSAKYGNNIDEFKLQIINVCKDLCQTKI